MREDQRVVAFIQARVGSSRLPGKIFADLSGEPVLWRVVERVRASKLLDEVVVATSVEEGDNQVESFCKERGVACFRGSELNLLDRYYQAAVSFDATAIVRITADCPLIDPTVIDEIVQKYLDTDFDFVTNALHYTYPDGLDVEVITFDAFERAWREESKDNAEREYVTRYIRTAGDFSICNVENPQPLSGHEYRWSLDEPADLEFLQSVYSELFPKHGALFNMYDVLALLEERPELATINDSIRRNEGYLKSMTGDAPCPAKSLVLRQSLELRDRALKTIPSAAQTFSKNYTQFVQGACPVFLSRAEGAKVWDVDGNDYIDWVMGLGAVILGHGDEDVREAIDKQVRDGIAYSLPHSVEVDVAELLVDIIPCAEMARFGKNGSDVTSGAVRAARAYTKRDRVAICGYHGWHDFFIGTTTRDAGVPKATADLSHTFRYNNLESLEKLFTQYPNEFAAVIMEPVGIEKPEPGFLEGVQELARRNGSLLIYDELVTGFRFSIGGAQKLFGVTPDLACFGKGIANGMPLAAVVGRRDVMEIFDEIFFSLTFGGEAVSLAAAKATLQKMSEKNVTDMLWDSGQTLIDGYNYFAEHFGVSQTTHCAGYPPRSVIMFSQTGDYDPLLIKSYFQQECFKRGVFFLGGHMLSFRHSFAEIDHTLLVYRTALELLAARLADGDLREKLQGDPVLPVFRAP